MSRFDYVQYDDHAADFQALVKEKFIELEATLKTLKDGRAKSLVMISLEEAYMWSGKAIRDEQIERNGSAEPQEERCDS